MNVTKQVTKQVAKDVTRVDIVAPNEVRRALTAGGDFRGDVAFQHDVNALLARIEQAAIPWRSLAEATPSEVARTRTLDGIGLAPLVVERLPRVERRAGRSR